MLLMCNVMYGLLVQEQEDRKRIQHLLALTQPVSQEVGTPLIDPDNPDNFFLRIYVSHFSNPIIYIYCR